jgi:hypothetical protein
MPWAKHRTVAYEGAAIRQLYAVAGEVFEPGAEVSLVDTFGTVIVSRVITDELIAQEAWCWTSDSAELVVLVNGKPLTEQAWSVVVGSAPLRRL